jgi:hypothetical protein
MRMFQFMTSGVGCGNVGKNANRKAIERYTTEIPFIQIPALPRLNLEGSSVSLRQRLRNMHEMEMMYDESNAQVPSDAMELKATVDPMLIMDNAMETPKDTSTELRGMSQPGRT